MRRHSSFVGYGLTLLGMAAACLPSTARAQNTQAVYADSLGAGWQSWSWCAVDFASHDYAHGGASSIKATITAPYQGLYFHCDPLAGSLYSSITFWIHGGTTSGRSLCISGIINGNYVGNIALDPFIAGGSVAAGQWRQVTVPLSALGMSTTTAMTGFWIADTGTYGQPAFYVDDVLLNAKPANTAPVAIRVDAGINRHAINAQVYGTAYASSDMLADLNITLNRQGGNAATRYNWQQNASNHASDWYFESIPEGDATPGGSIDNFIAPTLAARAQAMITVPTIGWVAKLGANSSKTSSFSVKKYGAQQSVDGWMPDAGNGVLANGQNVAGNNPNDANVASDSTFQQNWIKHITGLFGTAAKGGVSYYLMDNEPSIWHYTHRDVHPTGATMNEIKTKIIDYAAKIKAADAGAQIVGPEEWGWSGFFYSGYDQQYGNAHGWGYLPDRSSQGGADYMPWLLNSLKTYDTANKTKSLDVFSLHYYPQSGEFSNDTSAGMQILRNRSTRSLWDPNYVDASWIGTQVQLIPRMKSWVNSYYPGLKTALTEYNWGAEGHINGATTQADILGIFGREGLDMAARWTTPDPTTPTYKAIKMFRNVDGIGDGFGDVSVSDVTPDPDNLSSFAAVRSSDGALTVMLINKALSGTAQANVSLANFTPAASAPAWQLTSANAINSLPAISVSKPANASPYLTLNLPAQSITLVTVPPAASATVGSASATFVGVDKTTQGTWKGKYGNDGYNVISDGSRSPSYGSMGALGGASSWTWSANTTVTPALQKVSATGRIAACWYNSNSFGVDVNLTDAQTHQVALYCLDYDSTVRAQTLEVLDGTSNVVLNTQSLSGFQNGAYMIWNIKGHVKFRLTMTGGANAVLGGVFFDAQGGGASSSTSATFVKADTSTSGSWKGRYGLAGYNVIGNAVSYPSYAGATSSGQSSWTWAASTTNPVALQKAGTATDRIAACLYSAGNFVTDIALTDGQTHQVSLYCVDYDSTVRAQTIDVLDAATNAVLSTQSLSSFKTGTYMVWNIKGHVKFRITRTAGANAVLSGLYFD